MCTCNSNVLSASLHDYLWWMRTFVRFVIHFLVNVPTNARVNTHTKQAGFLLMTCLSLLKGWRRRNCNSEKANVLSCCWSLWSVSAFFIKKSIAGTSNTAACWSYVDGDRPSKSVASRTGVSVASLNIRLNKSEMLARFIYLSNWNESYSRRKYSVALGFLTVHGVTWKPHNHTRWSHCSTSEFWAELNLHGNVLKLKCYS